MTNGPSSGAAKNSIATDGSGTTAFTTSTGRTVHSVDISATTTKRRPYLRAEDRRRHLLDAVGRSFDRAGFGGVTMAGTATEAGVSRQLVYDHFGDLDTLYEAFVEDRLARYRDGRPDVSGLSPEQAAAAMFEHLLAIPSSDRRVVRLLVADVGLPALDRVRARFRRDELARWPVRPHAGAGRATADAALWAATSALLALADAVTDGAATASEATEMAVGIVRAVSAPRATDGWSA